MTCQACGLPTRVFDTMNVDKLHVTYRKHECDCGLWWETEERIIGSIRPLGPIPVNTSKPVCISSPVLPGISPLSDPSTNVTKSRSRARNKAEPARFSEFWGFFPRKVARLAAVRMWISKELDQHADAIIESIQLQRDAFVALMDEGKPDKVPHAATWLNGERWKDVVDRRPRLPGRPSNGVISTQQAMIDSGKRFLDRHKGVA